MDTDFQDQAEQLRPGNVIAFPMTWVAILPRAKQKTYAIYDLFAVCAKKAGLPVSYGIMYALDDASLDKATSLASEYGAFIEKLLPEQIERLVRKIKRKVIPLAGKKGVLLDRPKRINSMRLNGLDKTTYLMNLGLLDAGLVWKSRDDTVHTPYNLHLNFKRFEIAVQPSIVKANSGENMRLTPVRTDRKKIVGYAPGG